MEYPKIETVFERDENFKVIIGKLRNPIFGIIKKWQFTEKIDGTNIRIIWQDGKLSFGGRAENSNIPADLVNHLQYTAEAFKQHFDGKNVVVYGEGYGAGIQKGGGYSKEKRFVVFDVLIDNKWWLNWENTCDVAAKLGLETVPYIGEWTLGEAMQNVRHGFYSELAQKNTGEFILAEGLVGRTAEPLFDKHGKRIIIKLKTKDFKHAL